MASLKFAAALLFGTGALTAGTLFAVADPVPPPCGGNACPVQTAAVVTDACCGGAGDCRGTDCGSACEGNACDDQICSTICDAAVIPASAVAVCTGESAGVVKTACAERPSGTYICTAGGCEPATACEVQPCGGVQTAQTKGRVRGSLVLGFTNDGFLCDLDCEDTVTGGPRRPHGTHHRRPARPLWRNQVLRWGRCGSL